jgi:hypothetical protein
MAGTAFAKRGVPITEKPRPAYDPLGIRAGAFTLMPELGLGLEYNDNVYAVEGDEESDWITVIKPNLEARSDWSRHALNLDTGIRAGVYGSNSDENYLDGHLLVDGRLDVLRESFLTARTGVRRLHEERGDPNVSETWDEPAVYYKTFGDLAYYHGLGKISIKAGTGLTNYSYEKVDLTRAAGGDSEDLDYRDRNVYNVNARLAYDLHPDVQPFIISRYEWRDYDDPDPGIGEKRDSEGYRIGAGTGFDLGGVTSGEIYGGYMHQDYESLDNVSGPWYGLSLLWNVTQMTSVQAKLERSIKETTSRNAAGIRATDASLRVDHELLRNLLVGAFINYTHDDYKGISRTDEYMTVGPRLTYFWNRSLSADLVYSYKQRDSDLASVDDYEENKLILGLTGRF